MSESLVGKGIVASVAATVPRSSLLTLVCAQALLCGAAFLVSVPAGFVASAVSLISLFRYLMLAAFASLVGRSRPDLVFVSASLWGFFFLVLAAAIVAVSRLAHAQLVWAAAAACLGPFVLTGLAFLAGGRALVAGHRIAGGLR